MAKKIKNDQGELIERIKRGEFFKAWEMVKYIGFKFEGDINMRYLIFNKAFQKFDPYENNNFIYYFMNQIKFDAMERADRKLCVISSNRKIVNRIKMEHCSPSDEDKPEIIKDVLSFYY